MADFNKAVEKTIKLEGGYTAGHGDYGGETKFGISKRAHPDVDIPKLDVDSAKDIYKRFYWDVMRLDDIDSQAVADEMFDTGVNTGWKDSASIMQTAVNLVSEARKMSTISVDGLVGPVTVNRINGLTRSATSENVLLKIANGFQMMEYINQATRDPNQAKFLIGWIANRIEL